MEKTKLEVIRLVNEDVIATSVVACKDAFGVIQINQEDNFSGYKNNNVGSGADYYDGGEYSLQNYTNQSGYYHFTISGKKIVIGEKCPHNGNDNEVFENHSINPGF